LAEARLADAKVRLKNRRYDGAYYLAGYAIECALKACIAGRAKRHDFPDLELARKVWQRWTERSRYQTRGMEDARNMVAAVGDELGVLAWLRKYW
jgi:HEPN domain-containing protein